MGAHRARDERIGRVDRSSSACPVGLIPPGATRSLPVGSEEPEAVE